MTREEIKFMLGPYLDFFFLGGGGWGVINKNGQIVNNKIFFSEC